jgi:dCTP deaminase
MSVLSAQTIRRLGLVRPMREAYRDPRGNSVGLSCCGYDISIAESVLVEPGQFVLASAREAFNLPTNVVGIVHDKSSLAREGLAVQNTVLEPGWRGFITLELSNHWSRLIVLSAGDAVAQVIFHWLDEPTELPYRGKYQDQEAGPQSSRSAQS